MRRLETSAVDTEPDHLLVQGAPWNLEALQRRPDIAAGLKQTGLKPGVDYRLVVIGLDPNDGPTEAQAMKHAQIDDVLAAASTFFLADTSAVR